MFCIHCGYNLEENSNFCGSCGASQGGSQPGIAPGTGANTQNAQNGYNRGAAGQPHGQAFFGNHSVNMQGQGYMPPILASRPYSHSLTLALIATFFIFLSIISLLFGIVSQFFGPVSLLFVIIGLGLSIFALILGALHLGKRSCAAGGFVLGIISTFYHVILLFIAVIIFSLML